jgi:V8-like Glu-specific endopeptidase
MDRIAQAAAAATRYRDTKQERADIEQRQRADNTQVVATPEQVEARFSRLARVGHVPPEALLRAVSTGDTVDRTVLLERIIDASNDLQAANFLARGARAAHTVGRISEDRNGRRVPFGTGFLVGARLLLTNNHVLPDRAAAAGSVVELNCETDVDNQPATVAAYRLDPATLFLTDQDLDYTLVAVAPGADGRPPGAEFGWNRLVWQQGKIVIGEAVNVIGHPMGRLKEVAVRNNSLLNELDRFLHYTTDTEPGNSGSPVYNDQWEVVALHHSGVPRTDSKGNWLKRDGSRWQPQDGEGAVEWIANEGVRASVLLTHLHTRPRTAADMIVLAELGPQALPPGAVAVSPGAISAPPGAVAVSPGAVAVSPGAVAVSPGAVVGSPGGVVVSAGAVAVSPGAVPAVAPLPTVPGAAVVVEVVEAGRAGLPARRPPLAGSTHLVFLHGRSQQGKDPARLRAGWAAGLAGGLGAAGLPTIDPADVWFPYYGDALAGAVDRREAVDTATPVYEELVTEAALRAGMPVSLPAETREGIVDGLVGRLRRPLGWLANRSGLDETLIAAVFRDVAAYLDRPAVRALVLDTVLGCLPDAGRVVLVSHSLGTVVAMDLLTRLPAGIQVDTLVTAGSPLGMDAVYKRLLAGGPQRPQRVGRWVNAWCAADAVAIGCPLSQVWGHDLTEVLTDNAKDRAHDMAEYLSDARVAKVVEDGLRAG